MSHHHIHTPPPPTGGIELPAWARALAIIAAVVGAWTLFRTYGSGRLDVAWSSYLIGVFYVLGLGVFGVLWVSILYLCRGVWSVSMRRIPEAMAAWLLPGGVLTMLVAVGGHTLYHWTHVEAVAQDPILSHKAPFLNLPMFYALVGVSLATWVVLAFLMVRNSLRQDEVGGVQLSRANTTLAAIFAVTFAVTVSVVSFYLLMSLEPHWFSTMYAVLIFTDVVQTGTAFVTLVVGLLIAKGSFGAFVNENHLHSLTKMMFATTGFWAYIYFCQFLLIWYANIPEETLYFITRYENGWLPWLIALPLVKWLIPFVILAPRENKRKIGRVVPMAILILVAQFFELYMLVSPAIGHGAHKAHAHLPWVEFLVTAGFFGAFFLVFAWSLGRHKPIPLKDPRMRDCLEYHQ